MNFKRLTLIVLGCLTMIACTSAAKQFDYVPDYQSAVVKPEKDLARRSDTDQLSNLFELFSDLKGEQTKQRIEKTYSKSLYFNDTLHTFSDRDQLSHYLLDGAQRADEIKVYFEDVAISGEDYYLRWLMEMKFKVMGKTIESKSIGISQLRFDERGKIVFHQDFWDNTNGFFGHLPVLGTMISKVKSAMK